MIKISVLMPCYNAAQWLDKSIGSVLAQTLTDFELICIDDGSKDDTPQILMEYAKKDARIKLIIQSNHGAGESRNIGIRNSKGEYLFFMDADDWIDKNFLETVYNVARNSNADVVETTKSYNVWSPDKLKLFNKRNAHGFCANGVAFRRDVIWDKLFKADFIKNNNITFSNGLCHNDAFFLLQSLFFKAKVVRENTAIYYHNKANETSIRYKTSDKKLLSQLDMFILEIEFLNSHFFNYYDYNNNYKKLVHTAKIKRKYIKEPENKKNYADKLQYIISLNKYPFFKTLVKALTSSRFKEELRESKAKISDYPEMLKKWYRKKSGKSLNLDNPQTFNEKIQWLKLNDSTPEKTRLADKYLVREYIKDTIGEKYLVPLLGVYDKFDDIDFDVLPEAFVIKCNHGSGMNAVVTDKNKIDRRKLKKEFDSWMAENFGFVKGFQLHYNYIPHKIVIEKYIPDLDDYKFFCYNGKCLHVLHKYTNNKKACYCNFDRNFNCLPLSPKSTVKEIVPPHDFEQVCKMAEVLSSNFSFVRIDFYITKDKVYFSEMTFTPSSGTNSYIPEWDKKLGDWLDLEKLK